MGRMNAAAKTIKLVNLHLEKNQYVPMTSLINASLLLEVPV